MTMRGPERKGRMQDSPKNLRAMQATLAGCLRLRVVQAAAPADPSAST